MYKTYSVLFFIIYFLNNNANCNNNFSFINLPESHLSYYFNNYEKVKLECLSKEECEFRSFLQSTRYKNDVCWGYEEKGCGKNDFSKLRCPGDHAGWVQNKQAQINAFKTQADFGYVKQFRDEMRIVCEPLFEKDSYLECSDHLSFCRGRNIMLNLTQINRFKEPLRYKMDILNDGQIGGYCSLLKSRLNEQLDRISALQSWGPELRNFKQLETRPIESQQCDIVIDKPTIIMKVDATVNMYHHFCDFFNLYASLHVNSTHERAFDINVHILVWETYTYNSPFRDTFDAFTQHPIWDLKTFRGKVVCFKNLMLPLLPRMIFGLYYNTPIIYGCENSGLFQAFSEHILHRLGIQLYHRTSYKIRITVISRQTKYRRILNENQLMSALSKYPEYDVSLVAYDRELNFKEQLELTRNTDILIGMHGAGLTHLLFLPNWATVFELYNCEDPNCYRDLARLRGINYLTWQKKSKLKVISDSDQSNGAAHAKFANYRFDVAEFLRLVKKAADSIKQHIEFINMTSLTAFREEL